MVEIWGESRPSQESQEILCKVIIFCMFAGSVKWMYQIMAASTQSLFLVSNHTLSSFKSAILPFTGIPFSITDGVFFCLFVFYQLKVCSNLALSKSISAIFPTVFTHFVPLCHTLVVVIR